MKIKDENGWCEIKSIEDIDPDSHYYAYSISEDFLFKRVKIGKLVQKMYVAKEVTHIKKT